MSYIFIVVQERLLSESDGRELYTDELSSHVKAKWGRSFCDN